MVWIHSLLLKKNLMKSKAYPLYGGAYRLRCFDSRPTQLHVSVCTIISLGKRGKEQTNRSYRLLGKSLVRHWLEAWQGSLEILLRSVDPILVCSMLTRTQGRPG